MLDSYFPIKGSLEFKGLLVQFFSPLQLCSRGGHGLDRLAKICSLASLTEPGSSDLIVRFRPAAQHLSACYLQGSSLQ